MHKSIASIRPENLDQKGMIVGHMNYSNTQTKESLGGLFGPNFRAYATRLGDQKKVYEVWIENKDDGYFGWLVEPGTYWVHGCEIKDLNGETSLYDLKPNLEVKAGELTYIGHIGITIGKTDLGATLKKTFSSGIKENLSSMGSLLVAAEQEVSDNISDMHAYLNQIGLGNKPVNSQVVESWKYEPN